MSDPGAPGEPTQPANEPAVAPALAEPAPTSARKPPDPWAHRRGEPRVFAFLWALFLFAATLTTFGTAAAGGVLSHDTLRPAARTLLVIIASGISLAWPLLRLSQLRDPKPLLGPFQDAIVVLVPLHAVLWPQILWWLAHWPLRVVAALAALLSVWTFLIAGLLALAQVSSASQPASHAIRARSTWMLMFVCLALAGAAPAMFQATRPTPRGDVVPPAYNAAWMTSPIAGALEISRDRSWAGRPAAVVPQHGRAIAIIAGIALLVWVLAGLRSRRYTPRVRFARAPESLPSSDTSARPH